MKSTIHKYKFFFYPLFGIAFISLIGLVVMSLWNALLPDILHVTTITFWQAIGIFVLCKILFGFGGKGGKGGPPWMKGRMAERFKNMNPEEREKFKEEWAQRCGGWGGKGFGHGSAERTEQGPEENINPS